MTVGAPGSSASPNNALDSSFSGGSSSSVEMDNVSMDDVWYDVKGYHGDDEKILKNQMNED